jgi:hypothetical protein
MKSELIVQILTGLYSSVLRELLVEAVHRTDNEWDDRLVAICDALLKYDPLMVGKE